jgi:hypothetical protein
MEVINRGNLWSGETSKFHGCRKGTKMLNRITTVRLWLHRYSTTNVKLVNYVNVSYLQLVAAVSMQTNEQQCKN